MTLIDGYVPCIQQNLIERPSCCQERRAEYSAVHSSL